jgi:hypothetical protein
MNLSIQRRPSYAYATIGSLFVDGVRRCYTLEDEVREQKGIPVANWKVPRATAIPEGRYKVTLELSQRFGPDTLTINDVPGFTSIRMHAGNISADTEGCVLLGMQASASMLVGGTSRPAVELIKGLVRDAIDAGDEVWIEIENALMTA